MRYLFASALLLLFYAIVGCLTYHGGQVPAAALARPVPPTSASSIQTVLLPAEDLPSPSTPANLVPENPAIPMPATPWHPTKQIGVGATARPSQRGDDGKRSADSIFRHPLSTF